MSPILTVLPGVMLPPVIAAVGVAVILRLLGIRAGLAAIVGLLLSLILGPLARAAFALLPLWTFLLIILFVLIKLARRAAEVVIGKEAAEHMVGSLAADTVRGLFKLLLLPFRLALEIFSRHDRG